jgi:wyosine [tRNA(Phe)-imidazoG37] synthetase (radical SAM superfamily)
LIIIKEGEMEPSTIAFGPVPSRRLGHSMGVNNIPAKTCSYGCIYCQVGRTTSMQIEPKAFFTSGSILSSVATKLKQCRSSEIPVDYVTFVADGEPTLDINLKQEIQGVKELGCKTAVISNASLIWRTDVQDALIEADWVSLKVDAVIKNVWRRINRPHGKLSMEKILEGAMAFSDSYPGKLVTETMLIRGINDDGKNLNHIAAYLSELKPETAYLSVPTRPPAEARVHPPRETQLQLAYEIFRRELSDVAFNISYEGDDFQATDDVASDLLGITAVHPMREDAVFNFLRQAGSGKEMLESLVLKNKLVRIKYQSKTYYLRHL